MNNKNYNKDDYIESLEQLLIFMCQTYRDQEKTLLKLYQDDGNRAFLKVPRIQGSINTIGISQLAENDFENPKLGFLDIARILNKKNGGNVMNQKEMYILMRCWELEDGESFIEYFGDDCNGVDEKEFMPWLYKKGYISKEKLELFKKEKMPSICECLHGYKIPYALFPNGECNEDATFKSELLIAEYLEENKLQDSLKKFIFEGENWASFDSEEEKQQYKNNIQECVSKWNDDDLDGFKRIKEISIQEINDKLKQERIYNEVRNILKSEENIREDELEEVITNTYLPSEIESIENFMKPYFNLGIKDLIFVILNRFTNEQILKMLKENSIEDIASITNKVEIPWDEYLADTMLCNLDL